MAATVQTLTLGFVPLKDVLVAAHGYNQTTLEFFRTFKEKIEDAQSIYQQVDVLKTQISNRLVALFHKPSNHFEKNLFEFLLMKKIKESIDEMTNLYNDFQQPKNKTFAEINPKDSQVVLPKEIAASAITSLESSRENRIQTLEEFNQIFGKVIQLNENYITALNEALDCVKTEEKVLTLVAFLKKMMLVLDLFMGLLVLISRLDVFKSKTFFNHRFPHFSLSFFAVPFMCCSFVWLALTGNQREAETITVGKCQKIFVKASNILANK